jgi:hypothetical protein
MIDWSEPNTAHPLLTAENAALPVMIAVGESGVGKTQFLGALENLDMDCTHMRPPRLPRTYVWAALRTTTTSLRHWSTVWRDAILVSCATFVAQRSDPQSVALHKVVAWLEGEAWLEYSSRSFPRHPFSIAGNIAAQIDDMNDDGKRRWLESDSWLQLESLLREVAPDGTSLILVIDDFHTIPQEDPILALEVEAGMAAALVSMARQPLPSVTLRAAISGRAMRYLSSRIDKRLLSGNPIREIIWTKNDLSLAANTMVDSWCRDNQASSIPILDSERVEVPLRRSTEDPVEYLLRHSSLNAGDLWHHINALLMEVSEQRRPLSQDEYRYTISQGSAFLVDCRKRAAANELAAYLTLETVESGTTILPSTAEARIDRFLQMPGSEIFSRVTLNKLIRTAIEARSTNGAATVLWAHGLITVVPILGGSRHLPKRYSERITTSDLRFSINPIVHDVFEIRKLELQEVTFEYR